jgi:hypothetical protein
MCEPQIDHLLIVAVGGDIFGVRAFFHPMQIAILRIGLVPEIGHVPLRFRTVGCIETIQDVKWLQRGYVANITMHEQGVGKARVLCFSVILYVVLVEVSLFEIFSSFGANKLCIEPG